MRLSLQQTMLLNPSFDDFEHSNLTFIIDGTVGIMTIFVDSWPHAIAVLLDF